MCTPPINSNTPIIIDGTVVDESIEFSLTYEQFTYIQDVLSKAHHRREYSRLYMRGYRDTGLKHIHFQPTLLLYQLDSEKIEPSIYVDQVKVSLNQDSVIVRLTIKQYQYMREVLHRQYQKKLASQANNEKKKSSTTSTRRSRISPSYLIGAIN